MMYENFLSNCCMEMGHQVPKEGDHNPCLMDVVDYVAFAPCCQPIMLYHPLVITRSSPVVMVCMYERLSHSRTLPHIDNLSTPAITEYLASGRPRLETRPQ